MSDAGVARLPLPVRAWNATGGLLRALGVPLLDLDAEALLGRARRATGLADFGDPAFREPLEVFLASLDAEAGLTALGRGVARRDLVRLLENRLRMQDVRRRHPEIADERVEAPIFILGLPRTGTSILHELLAQDPAVRAPLTWEVMHPWPPPERASHGTDPRIEQVERHFSGVDRLLPEFKRMHAMGARLPQECAALTAHDFATMIWHTQFRVPRYQAWFEAADHGPVYAGHRRQLQYLQWRCPGAPWVLKSPQHLWTLDALLDVYPDARIVQTHRDPLEVVASLTSLCCMLRSLCSDRVDPREVGADWSARLARGLAHTETVRAGGRLPAERVFDLDFRAFVGDEIGALRRIYQHFGMTLSPEAEGHMRRYLDAHPRGQHGAHRYRLSDAGLDEAALRRRFAFYSEAHGL